MLLSCGVGEGSWESPGLQGDSTSQSWISTRRINIEAETPILWPPDAKCWFIGKDPDAVKDWREQKKGTTEDEMVGWHHWLNEHEFEQAPEVGDGLGSLACCSPRGDKESDVTEQLNWTAKNDTKKEAENRSRLTDRENNLILRGGGRDKLGLWDLQIHTTACEINEKVLLWSTGNCTQYVV